MNISIGSNIKAARKKIGLTQHSYDSMNILNIKNKMDAFCENPDMISSCRGFTRDMYKYMLGTCLGAGKFEEAASLYHELEATMDIHFNHYQVVLADEKE